MLINKKAIRDFVVDLNPELRTSKEFFFELNIMVMAKVEKAVKRNRSLSKITLGKDELNM